GTERNADRYRTTGREGPLAPTHSASPHSRIGPPTSLRCYGRQIIAPPWSRKIPRLPAQAPEVHFLQDYDGPAIAAGENQRFQPRTTGGMGFDPLTDCWGLWAHCFHPHGLSERPNISRQRTGLAGLARRTGRRAEPRLNFRSRLVSPSANAIAVTVRFADAIPGSKLIPGAKQARQRVIIAERHGCAKRGA